MFLALKVGQRPHPTWEASFLRSFPLGHVRQLGVVACRVLVGLSTATPLPAGVGSGAAAGRRRLSGRSDCAEPLWVRPLPRHSQRMPAPMSLI